MKKSLFFIACLIACYSLTKFILQPTSDVLHRDTLIIGTSADYPPYASIDLESSEIIGFDIDIAKEIAHRLNKKIIIRDMPFNSLIFDLFAGQIDIIAAGLTPDEHRKKTVLFSRSYLDSDPLIIITKKEHPPIGNITDLYGKSVAVNTGYTTDMYLSQISEISLVRLESTADAIMALRANSVYAFASAQSSLNLFLQTQKNDHGYQFFTLPTPADCYALAYEKNNIALKSMIDSIINDMERDGTLQKLKNKWNI